MAEVLANGVRLHVQRFGRGPPTVVFLHGLVMDNLSSFYFTLAHAVAKRAEVVLFDLRGHGRSEHAASGYSLENLTADLEGLVSVLGLSAPLHLVGNSFGGQLALSFASLHPEAMGSIVLLDAHVGRPGWGPEMAKTLGLQGEERDRRIAEGFRHWLGRNDERRSSRLAQTARALVENTTLIEDLRGSRSLTDEVLRAVRCPVLALYGEHSDLRQEAEALPGLIPTTTLSFRANCTHSILWEDTEWLRAELVRWFEGRT